MINTEIEMYIPDFSKFPIDDEMQGIAYYMEGSLKRNFAEGGRPKWANKKDGSPSYLFKTGKLFGSIVSGYTKGAEAWAGIENTASVPYAFAQNFGYAPRNLVARQFVMFQKEDEEYIVEKLDNAIVEFWTTQKEEVK